jgi:uncharacterized membrane protein YphA (DoxX/SURF4 family)
MAANRESTGLVVVRIAVGIFMLFVGLGKLGWLIDAAPLTAQLRTWVEPAWPANRWFLETVAIPGARVFARLVVLGELACGVALMLGAWTRLAALLGFLMVLTFHFASGAIFQYKFLTNGYGLPVLGALLALAIGGAKLPWSVKR